MATSRAAPQLLSYVLHQHDWSESSLIVELFTRERGRVVVAAKGAKRPTSNFRAVLLPFQPLHALLGRTPADEQSEVHTLRGAEWAGGRPLLGAAAMFSAYYLNELLLQLLVRQDAHPALFDAYADTLAALATRAESGEEAAVLRAFELILLRELGWLPELALTTQTAEPLRPAGRYSLHPEAGVCAAANAGGLAGADWVLLEAALAHGSGETLRQACAPVAGALRAPLRELLHHHLGHDRLRTRQVWRGVQRLNEIPRPA
ncbi:DNA repair protein RecO [Rubrivivax sp. A210]|uniref:DNA repair protein RecO n=1 Tax=Rubrivivax sp. A210 TaxID=2772301 RepID=UPI0019182B10|nr:DNA repair protein RecO [Rubrivivax sp. A210]CAD5370639.1 DNA repair protein RecO [Rubrivivax sp. A210]